MAGQTHVIRPPASVQPWPLAFELASTLPKSSWVLIGGLMVHLHALRAGVIAMRPTSDVDLLLDIATTSAGNIGRAITGLGFETVEPSRGNPVHRFMRGTDVVDRMVDSRNPQRDLEDLAVLGAATGTPRALGLDRLTPKDRRHLNRVIPFLTEPRHISWAPLDPYDRELGQRIWARIADAVARPSTEVAE